SRDLRVAGESGFDRPRKARSMLCSNIHGQEILEELQNVIERGVILARKRFFSFGLWPSAVWISTNSVVPCRITPDCQPSITLTYRATLSLHAGPPYRILR